MHAVECRTYFQLIDALAARRLELRATLAELDEVAGLAERHSSKVFSRRPTKYLGPITLSCLLAALGLKIVVVEDPEALERVEHRYRRRGPWFHRLTHTGGPSSPAVAADSISSPAAI